MASRKSLQPAMEQAKRRRTGPSSASLVNAASVRGVPAVVLQDAAPAGKNDDASAEEAQEGTQATSSQQGGNVISRVERQGATVPTGIQTNMRRVPAATHDGPAGDFVRSTRTFQGHSFSPEIREERRRLARALVSTVNDELLETSLHRRGYDPIEAAWVYHYAKASCLTRVAAERRSRYEASENQRQQMQQQAMQIQQQSTTWQLPMQQMIPPGQLPNLQPQTEHTRQTTHFPLLQNQHSPDLPAVYSNPQDYDFRAQQLGVFDSASQSPWNSGYGTEIQSTMYAPTSNDPQPTHTFNIGPDYPGSYSNYDPFSNIASGQQAQSGRQLPAPPQIVPSSSTPLKRAAQQNIESSATRTARLRLNPIPEHDPAAEGFQYEGLDETSDSFTKLLFDGVDVSQWGPGNETDGGGDDHNPPEERTG
ncbi:hypothetical protein LTS08_007677 [Lithohypha guttulata]|nr:hypothetical protein LTS08_007677 [Lithohypha guttulata]